MYWQDEVMDRLDERPYSRVVGEVRVVKDTGDIVVVA